MDRDLYTKLKKAKSEISIYSLEELYRENPDNLIIKFEYAKRLKRINLELSIKLLLELIGTSNENYALLELGIIEKEQSHYDKAREYFNRILNSSSTSANDKECALLELGKLEEKVGNTKKAYDIFLSLIGTKNECYAYIELGKIEFKWGNNNKAHEYLYKALNSKCWFQAQFWLGKIESSEGKILQAMIYFNELLNTPIKMLAIKEIEKIRNVDSNENKIIKK